MIDTTVVVHCDFPDGYDGCEAEFEVLRTGIPDAMRALVENQLRLRGWTGSIPGWVTCPLHRVGATPAEDDQPKDQP